MHILPECHTQYGVFTSAQADASGLSRGATRHLTSTGQLTVVSRGVLIETGLLASLQPRERALARAVAVCLRITGSALSHHTAALVHQLPLLGTRPGAPELTVPTGQGRSGRHSPSLTLRGAALPAGHVDVRDAWAVTTAARTVCDLTRETPLLKGLVIADAALARKLTTRAELASVADECARWPGSPRLRDVLRHANGAAESPYETVVRHHLQRAGQDAIPQVWAFDGIGPIGCGDLWLPDLWVFVEVDGDVKYDAATGSTVLLVEKRRQERLEDAGFGVARVSTREARQPQVLLDKVSRAVARGRAARAVTSGQLGTVGPPPRWARRGTVIPPATTPHL